MLVDWRLVSGFMGLGAYFLARFLGASVLGAVGIAVIVGVVIYAVARARGGRPRDPDAAPDS